MNDDTQHRGRSIIELVNDGRDDQVRNRYEVMWGVGLEFIKGNQYLDVTELRDGQPVNTRRSADRQSRRAIVNRIYPAYCGLYGDLSTVTPNIGVIPASMSYEDIMKAMNSQYYLQWLWSLLKLDRTIKKAIKRLIAQGTVALHTYWDEGDQQTKVRVERAANIIFEAAVDDIDESSFIAIRSFPLVEEMKDLYPKHADNIDAAQAREWERGGQRVPKDRAEVYDIYFRDGKHYIATASGVLLEERETPQGCMPVAVMTYSDILESPYGMSGVWPAVQPQIQLNWFRNQMMRYTDLNVNSPWLVSQRAGVSKITAEQNQIIRWSGHGHEPRRIQPGSMGGDVWNNVGLLTTELDSAMNYNQLSRGERAPGLRSGVAINEVKEGDKKALAMAKDSIVAAVSDTASNILAFESEYITEEKAIKAFDVFAGPVFKTIKETDILGVPDVHLEPRNLFLHDVGEHDKLLMQMFGAGLISHGDFIKEHSMFSARRWQIEKIRGLREAHDAVLAMRAGLEIDVQPDDDLQSMAAVAGEFTRSVEFYKLPMRSRMVIEAFIEKVHQMMLMQAGVVQPQPQGGGQQAGADPQETAAHNQRTAFDREAAAREANPAVTGVA